MALKRKEYLLTVDKYNRPFSVTGNEAVALNLVRLILLNPGSDPLHPEMGVGLKNYRYALSLSELTKRIEDQINTYLPQYTNASVDIIRTPDRVANIEITIDDTVYVYDSSNMPISIDLDQIQSS